MTNQCIHRLIHRLYIIYNSDLEFFVLASSAGCELGYYCEMGDVSCLRKKLVGCNPVQYALMCRLNISDPYFKSWATRVTTISIIE